MNDLRFAFRQLLKNPGSNALAVLTLALGIGANTVIFSAINAILLRPLPYRNPDRFVWVFAKLDRMGYERLPPNWANELFSEIMEQSQSFDQWARAKAKGFVLQRRDSAAHVRGMRVSAHLFEMLGVEPFLGRSFTSQENELGRHRVVLLSHEFWKEGFGGSPDILGKTIDLIDTEVSDRTGKPHDTLGVQSYTVIGVLPPRWQFPMGARPEHTAGFFGRSADIWEPESLTADEKMRRSVLDVIVARMKPTLTVERAEAEAKLLFQRLRKESDSVDGIELLPLERQAAGGGRYALPLLLGATGLVLLIACMNVANLLLARATSRQKEFAIRATLGADSVRLLRQLLAESTVLAFVGGACGLVLAFCGVLALSALNPANLPRLDEIRLDARVLSFTLCLSLTSGLLFGLAPALQACKTDLNDTLKQGGRNFALGFRRDRLRSSLVVSEVALSLVLLINAGLLIHSFIRLRHVDTGYEPRGVLTVPLSFVHPKYTNHAVGIFVEELLRQVGSLPGVESAAIASWIPVAGGRDRFAAGFHIEGRPAPDVANMSFVTAGYFRAMGIPLLRGRHFADQDLQSHGMKVKIVSESFVRKYFPGEEALGKRLRGVGGPGEIVGVVKDTLESSLDARPEPHIYHASVPSRNGELIVRTQGDEPSLVASAIRDEILKLDKDQLQPAVTPLAQILADSIAERRFQSLLLGLFSTLALILAAVGIYGLLTYTVALRTREIGIRMALGAQRRDVLSLVVREGMTLVIAGLFIGVAGALAATRLLAHQLFGVTKTDPATFAAVSALLASAALIACWLPARRATRINPIEALRYE